MSGRLNVTVANWGSVGTLWSEVTVHKPGGNCGDEGVIVGEPEEGTTASREVPAGTYDIMVKSYAADANGVYQAARSCAGRVEVGDARPTEVIVIVEAEARPVDTSWWHSASRWFADFF